MSEESETREKLLGLIRESVKQDEALRSQFEIGDKFRFIRDKLQGLLARTQEQLTILKQETERPEVVVATDEVSVYVYIFNAQGLDVKSWRNMLNPDVFYEYSISRPIYAEKQQAEEFINSRPTRTQHGYLTVLVKQENVLDSKEDTKDAIGNPLIKVKEGSLSIKRVVAFTHNNITYSVGPKGELTKKS